MVNEQAKQLSVACRYVPYDQWFITHIDPTWRIKHLKQRIIAKCLNLPFDPRSVQHDITPNARPPSPITFALRPDNPFGSPAPGDVADGDNQESTSGGGGGDQENDEREQYLEITSGKIGPSTVKPKSPTSVSPSILQQQQKQKQQEPQITTHSYTLFRFSTGQILEEDFHISWYDFQPHELVELHSSSLPPTFSSAHVSPMSLSPHLPNIDDGVASTSTRKKKSSRKNQEDLPVRSVTSLPRHIPNSYIQPYWQGWVRALRVLWEPRPVRPMDEHAHKLPGDNDYRSKRGREGSEAGEERRVMKGVEWRERWIVIQDGVLSMSRSVTDPNPHRLPLSSLKDLQGAEYLANSSHLKYGTRKPPGRSKPRVPDPTSRAGTPTKTTVGPSDTRTHSSPDATTSKSLSVPGGSRKSQERIEIVTHNLEKNQKDEKRRLFSTASSPSLGSPGQYRPLQRMSSYMSISTSTTLAPTTTPVVSKIPPPVVEVEERERLKALKRREAKEKTERELEALKKWDDISFSFGLGGKAKSKDKVKDKSKGKGRERDKEENRAKELRPPSPNRNTSSRQQHKDNRTKHSDHTHKAGSRSKLSNDKRYIPTSREEAQQAGMKIVCAKFRIKPTARQQDTGIADSDLGFPQTRRYTSTGPSLALIASGVKTSTGPHLVVDSDVSTLDDYTPDSSVHYGRQSQAWHGNLTTPSLSNIPSSPTVTISTASSITAAVTGTDSGSTSPISKHAGSTWNKLGGKGIDDKESIIIERRTTTDDDMKTVVAKNDLPPIVIPLPPSPIIKIETNKLGDESNDSSPSVSTSSPVFAHGSGESDLDDETFVKYRSGGACAAVGGVGGSNKPRSGYRFGGYHSRAQTKNWKSEGEEDRSVGGGGGGGEISDNQPVGQQHQQGRRGAKEQEGRLGSKDQEREEWLALDMVNDNAFNSILRILHRHSPAPLSSSFTPHAVIGPSTSPVSSISSKSKAAPSNTGGGGIKNLATSSKIMLASQTNLNHLDQQSLSMALPYPEWRLEVVNRARRAGMRETGRPLDLALHGWGREFEEVAIAARERKFKKEEEQKVEKEKKRTKVHSHAFTIKRKDRKVNVVLGGSDDSSDEDDGGILDTTQLDSDSEEESDTEWLAWMADLPRQFLAQESQLAVQPSQIPGTTFTNPFSSSPLTDDGAGPVQRPRTQEEERLLHADKMRKLEPSAVSTASPPSPSSLHIIIDPLPSPSPSEPLNYQRSSSSLTPFSGFPTNKGSHPMYQSRSLQHLRCVPEESENGHTLDAPSPSPSPSPSTSKHGLHHSASVDLSSWKTQVTSRRQNDSMGLEERDRYALGKPILTSEQIMQIESEVLASASSSSRFPE